MTIWKIYYAGIRQILKAESFHFYSHNHINYLYLTSLFSRHEIFLLKIWKKTQIFLFMCWNYSHILTVANAGHILWRVWLFRSQCGYSHMMVCTWNLITSLQRFRMLKWRHEMNLWTIKVVDLMLVTCY